MSGVESLAHLAADALPASVLDRIYARASTIYRVKRQFNATQSMLGFPKEAIFASFDAAFSAICSSLQAQFATRYGPLAKTGKWDLPKSIDALECYGVTTKVTRSITHKELSDSPVTGEFWDELMLEMRDMLDALINRNKETLVRISMNLSTTDAIVILEIMPVFGVKPQSFSTETKKRPRPPTETVYDLRKKRCEHEDVLGWGRDACDSDNEHSS